MKKKQKNKKIQKKKIVHDSFSNKVKAGLIVIFGVFTVAITALFILTNQKYQHAVQHLNILQYINQNLSHQNTYTHDILKYKIRYPEQYQISYETFSEHKPVTISLYKPSRTAKEQGQHDPYQFIHYDDTEWVLTIHKPTIAIIGPIDYANCEKKLLNQSTSLYLCRDKQTFKIDISIANQRYIKPPKTLIFHLELNSVDSTAMSEAISVAESFMMIGNIEPDMYLEKKSIMKNYFQCGDADEAYVCENGIKIIRGTGYMKGAYLQEENLSYCSISLDKRRQEDNPFIENESVRILCPYVSQKELDATTNPMGNCQPINYCLCKENPEICDGITY